MTVSAPPRHGGTKMTTQAHAPALDPGRPREPRALRPVDVDAAVDAARMLVALHERVERQFEAYEAAEGSHTVRSRAVAAVATALATHVAVEDELLYPALAAHTGRHDAEIERQLQQDHLLDLVMVELGGMLPADRGYDGKVRVLMQVFRQHARAAEPPLLLLAPLALAAALVLAGCGNDDGGGAATAAPVTGVTRVVAKDSKFTPPAVQVPAGTTLTWAFEDGLVPH